jgi:hypothetical protein
MLKAAVSALGDAMASYHHLTRVDRNILVQLDNLLRDPFIEEYPERSYDQQERVEYYGGTFAPVATRSYHLSCDRIRTLAHRALAMLEQSQRDREERP